MTSFFQYKDEYTITAKSLHGNEIDVVFDGENPDFVYLDDREWPVTCDSLNGIFVFMKPGKFSKLISLADLVRAARDEYPEIVAEVRREREAEERHADSCRAGSEKL